MAVLQSALAFVVIIAAILHMLPARHDDHIPPAR